mgnify:CR=1 FL=1
MIDKLRLHPGEGREMVRRELRAIAFIETSAAIRANYLRLGNHVALLAGQIRALRDCADALERHYPATRKENEHD